MKKRSKKGFTLAELLIVIAIIAVLVAIMFPVFGAQLNKARAAAELANVRAAYSEAVADSLLGTGTDLTDIATNHEIDPDVLKNALQYAGSTIDVKLGTPSSGTAHDAPGKITVTYQTFTGSFDIDGDVTFKGKTADFTLTK